MTSGNRKTPKVRQDGKTLVAAFQRANPPLIWKFDLERNHSFSIAVQGEDGDWKLGVFSHKEEFHPVARFLSRDDAEEAFAKTEKALLCQPSGGKWKMIAIGLMALLALFFLINIFNTVHRLSVRLPATSASGVGQQAAPIQEGVPMPADQVLKPPP